MTTRVPVLRPLPDERAVALELAEPVRRRLLEPARSIGYDLEPVYYAPVPDGPIVQQTPGGYWFFGSSWEHDPSVRQHGGVRIPEAELARIRALRDAGLSADLVWIGHELPQTWTPEQPLPALVPNPPHIRKVDDFIESCLDTAGRLAVSGTKTLSRGAAGTAVLGLSGLALGVATVAAIASVGLDPVVLAGVRHPSRDVAGWVLLAKWDWQ